MAAGDLTASTPVYVKTEDAAAVKAAIDAMNLAATTDQLFVIPVGAGRTVAIFKVQRAAA